MSFAINQNFDLKSRVKDFTRQNLTLDDLPVTRDADYPDDYMVAIDGKIYIFNSSNNSDPVTGKWREFKSGEGGLQEIPTASSTSLGGIKIGFPKNEENKNYPVELNENEQAYVNVPWVDLNTSYNIVSTSSDGLAPKLSGNSDQYLNGNGQYTTPPNTTYDLATTSSNGLLKQLTGNTGQYLNGNGQWTTPPNTTYELSSTENDGLLKQLNGSTTQFMRGDGTWATPYTIATDSIAGLVKIGYQENDKNYPIKLNSSGQMYVYVPWEENTEYSLPVATNTQLGGVKIGEGITVQSDGTISAADDVVTLVNLSAAKGDIAAMCAAGPFIANLYFINSPVTEGIMSGIDTGDYYHLCVKRSTGDNYYETTCSNVANTFPNINAYFNITNTLIYLKNNVIYHARGGTDAGYFVSNEKGDTLTNVASRFETLAEARAYMREKTLALPDISIVKCTSEEYESGAKDENTLYIIHG